MRESVVKVKVGSYIFLFLPPPGSRDPLLFGNGLRKSWSLYGRTTRQESAFVIQYFLESDNEIKQKRIGEMAEWLKALAWKACILLKVSRVRIPFSPPIFYKFKLFLFVS